MLGEAHPIVGFGLPHDCGGEDNEPGALVDAQPGRGQRSIMASNEAPDRLGSAELAKMARPDGLRDEVVEVCIDPEKLVGIDA